MEEGVIINTYGQINAEKVLCKALPVMSPQSNAKERDFVVLLGLSLLICKMR